jgi:DNA-binding NarL/FixJ family response regulator
MTREIKRHRPRVTKILLVDDHPMVRERLAEIINSEPDMAVCGEAEDRHRALELTTNNDPDLVIVDLTLKNSHGLDLVKDLRRHHPKLLMLVLSMHDESLHAERALRAGANGYITKQEATKNILLAIRQVLAGKTFMSEKIASRIVSKIIGTGEQQSAFAADRLTDRELRVLEMIGQGLTTRQIAHALHLDVSTVETYRTRIKQKLNLKNYSELLPYAIRWVHSGTAGN